MWKLPSTNSMKVQNNNLKISSDLLFRVLFHVIFWFFWLVLPILNSIMDDDKSRFEWLMLTLPLGFSTMPFFYFNSEFLIRRFLPKGKLTSYIMSLLVLFSVFLFAYYLLKDYLVDKYPIRIYDSRTLFPVLFIISMSTLYGFVIFMTGQSKKNQEEQAERLKSELSFLRSQISPHFIFNVLNSIVYLIRTKSKEAESVTLELSNLIRYMLYESENKQVLLEKEIEYLENYVKLQNVRFGDDVKINITMEGHTGSMMIEPMLLIPFVENAFKHGVGFIKNPSIDIFLQAIDGQKFVFKVKNLMTNEKSNVKDPNSGIGIRNVTRRIELLYPNSHNLEMKQENGFYEVYLELDLKNRV
jgi:two-component system, LytTR family, sensor kinase